MIVVERKSLHKDLRPEFIGRTATCFSPKGCGSTVRFEDGDVKLGNIIVKGYDVLLEWTCPVCGRSNTTISHLLGP